MNKERTHYALFPCGSYEGLLVPIQTARYGADQILAKLETWTDQEVANRPTLIATAAAFAGYSYVLLGEGFCTATVDAGPELSPAVQVFTLAEARFTKALGAAANLPEIKNLALVGRARARLDMGKKAEALADAEQVTPGFEYFAKMSGASDRSGNVIFQNNNLEFGF